jgi:hypothetical protein
MVVFQKERGIRHATFFIFSILPIYGGSITGKGDLFDYLSVTDDFIRPLVNLGVIDDFIKPFW